MTTSRASLLNSGVAHLADGKYELAQQEFIEILELAKADDDKMSRTLALYNLGVLSLNSGGQVEAEGWFVQALAAAREINFATVSALSLNALKQETE